MLVFLSCSKENGAAKKADGRFKVGAAAVVGKTVQRTVESTGTLAPWDEVIVGNETQGTIEKIFVDLGDRVSEGELLLNLDQRDARLNLNNADANLKKARAVWLDADLSLKRYEKLFSDGMVSISQRDAVKTQYDVAEAQSKQAEAQYELAKKSLSDTEIRSPINGNVKKRLVSVGETLKDKTPVFILVKNDPLKFQGNVPETFVPQVRVDQDIAVHIYAYPNTTFPGKIIRVSPSIDEKTRTLSIEARVPNPDDILKSGFFAKAVIKLKEEKDVPFVPEAAIYSFIGINKVYLIENGAVRERLIKTGIHEAGMVEITEGVKPGEMVATTGLDQLFDGAKVEIQTTDTRYKTSD